MSKLSKKKNENRTFTLLNMELIALLKDISQKNSM